MFTSARERRLWGWAIAAVAAVYAGLVPGPALAGVLRDNGLLEALFVLGALLVVSAVVALGLRVKPAGVEIGVALGVGAAYLMVLARMAVPEERTHLIEYGVIAALVHEALTERAGQEGRVPFPGLLAVLVTAVIGLADEAVQRLLPSRVFDIRDVGFNALAGLMAVPAKSAFRRARRRRGLTR